MLNNESQMVPCPEGTDKWRPPGWMKQQDSDTGPRGMNVPHIKIKLMQKLRSETERREHSFQMDASHSWLLCGKMSTSLCLQKGTFPVALALIFHYPKKKTSK